MIRADDNVRSSVGAGARLRYWRDEWLAWNGAVYRTVSSGDLEARVNRSIKNEFNRINLEQLELVKAKLALGQLSANAMPPTARKVTSNLVHNTLKALAGEVLLPASIEQPAWLIAPEPFPAGEMLATPNGLVHLVSLIEGKPCLLPPTPAFFSGNVMAYGFDPHASAPARWLAFLDSLWPDDPQNIEIIQEWFGLCLLPDTSFQKILFLVGPPRSGKGTIERILTALVGAGNVAGPPLASLGTDFGLEPLLGKTAAFIPDARLSGRTDNAIVVERLLAISGEDVLTVNRKHRLPVTTKMTARLAILSNELPRLTDASGALCSRMLLVKFTRSWLGREDRHLTAALLRELPGILLWAIAGWQRLRARGQFVQPQTGLEMLRELENLASPINAFISDCCHVGPEHETVIKDLYDGWKAWCAEKGTVHLANQQMFCKDLLAVLPNLHRSKPRGNNGKPMGVYRGIALTTS